MIPVKHDGSDLKKQQIEYHEKELKRLQKSLKKPHSEEELKRGKTMIERIVEIIEKLRGK